MGSKRPRFPKNVKAPGILVDPDGSLLWTSENFHDITGIETGPLHAFLSGRDSFRHSGQALTYETLAQQACAVVTLPLDEDHAALFFLPAPPEETGCTFDSAFAHFRQDIEEFLNCIKVGIYLTDAEGYTRFLNKESEKTGGLTADQVVGRHMSDLLASGYCSNSASLKVIESGQEEVLIQELGDGNRIMVTGTPFYHDGRMKMVVITERDMTEVFELRELLEENKMMAEKYQRELEYLKTHRAFKHEIVYESPEMKRVIAMSHRVARVDTTVLITGESGTGKELVAQMIYRSSFRKEGPMIRINCGAIPQNLFESELFGYEKYAFTGADRQGKMGLIELANQGVLFLDEIGEMPLDMQTKMLRVIQEGEIMRVGAKNAIPVDVRIIAATNIDLKKAVAEGRFREDLYYRLNVIPIEVPPLRKRKTDIRALAGHFLGRLNHKYKTEKTFDESALLAMESYDWPGNVRELENIIERMVVTTERPLITADHIHHLLFETDLADLVKLPQQPLSLKEETELFEKRLISHYLDKGCTATEIARLLQVNKSTITRKIQKLDLK